MPAVTMTRGCALRGISGLLVEVEADFSRGLPSFEVVGLPDAAIRESRERVRAAIKNAGYDFPLGRITVNLAPAGVRKVGVGLDLPIAVAVLAAAGQIRADRARSVAFIGELALDGSVRPVKGVLPACRAARDSGSDEVIVPHANAWEAENVAGVRAVGVASLRETVDYVSRGIEPPAVRLEAPDAEPTPHGDIPDFADVIGQDAAIRALEVSVAGGHNLIMVGPPGGGKTLLASCVPGILPEMDPNEALEVTCIQSVAGTLNRRGMAVERPFRRPHHSVTLAGMLGGGVLPVPGEVTLAHRGVLHLDEYCEFPRSILESLRCPMEDGQVTISRGHARVTFPSRFMLIASANPCPCGRLGDSSRACVCTADQINRYRRKLRGPVIDRIDIQIEVPRVDPGKIARPVGSRPSAQIRSSVRAARSRQAERYGSCGRTNSMMPAARIEESARLRAGARGALLDAVGRMALSVRSYHRLIKVSRTIADLDGSADVEVEHALEALQYRVLDTVS